MLLEIIPQWYGWGFPLHSHSMDEYNLLLEWKRVQHQFYSYFLVFVDRSDEKPCHTNKQTWEWESFVIAMILNSFNSFWINHPPPNHRVIYHQNLVLMIYQLTTQLGSPAILLRIKTWKPPDRQGSVTQSWVTAGRNPYTVFWPVLLWGSPLQSNVPCQGKEGLRVWRGQLWKAREKESWQLQLGQALRQGYWEPLSKELEIWFLPSLCVSFPVGRSISHIFFHLLC